MCNDIINHGAKKFILTFKVKSLTIHSILPNIGCTEKVDFDMCTYIHKEQSVPITFRIRGQVIVQMHYNHDIITFQRVWLGLTVNERRKLRNLVKI